MNKKLLFALLLYSIFSQPMPATAEPATPQRVRIGVDVRLGYQLCIDSWTPITEYLSRAIPGYRFVIVPLASHQDLERVLESGSVDFLSLDPALELMAEDRFGVVPLATMVESLRGETPLHPAEESCSGAIIRRADRTDLRNIADIRGRRLATVKPWSLTGWFAQWGVLVNHHIRPEKDLKEVFFTGTEGQVIKSVLDGTADVGAVDADMLFYFAKARKIPENALYVFDQQGRAVPLVPGKFVASTSAYPGRLVSKAAATSDVLAERVANALMHKSLNTDLDKIPCTIRWTVACNMSKVRRLLTKLMGPHFTESPGYPLPQSLPAWVYPALLVGALFVGAIVVVLLIRHRYVRRQFLLEDQLEGNRQELAEVRAEHQRINSILSLAGCGIDIVDDQNRIVYVDSGLERLYGDWRGKKCHEYFCNSDAPCPECKMPSPDDEPPQTVYDLDRSGGTYADDPHANVYAVKGESMRMIGIPFRDEGGRWMYARIHFPLMAFSEKQPR